MAPKTHDIQPIRATQDFWGLHPHEDIIIGKGGKVTFRTVIPFHDVAVVTKDEYDECDVSNAKVWVNVMGDLLEEGVGEVTKTANGIFYTFTYFANNPGTYYIVCTVDEGKHCLAGQKTIVTVTDEPSDEVVPVMGDAIPIWAPGIGYPEMTIDLGDSLRFVSDDQGYNDVALIDASECGAFNSYACCMEEGGLDGAEMLYSGSDFIAKQEYIWTPDAAGYYEVLSTLTNGLQCVSGQRFNLTVSPTADTPSNPTSAPTADTPSNPTSAALALQGSPFLLAAFLLAALL